MATLNMMTKEHRAIGALATLLCVLIAAPARGNEPDGSAYSLTAWGGESGELPGDVFAMAQDRSGFLWLGTPSGLVRFDGARFVRWPPPHLDVSLPPGPVHALVADPDGSLWVGVGGRGGVVRIRGDRVERHTVEHGAPPGVTDMIQDRDGAIWVATRSGIFRYADAQWRTMGPADGYPGAEAFSLRQARTGGIWASTTAGVFRWVDGAFTLQNPLERNVQDLVEDAHGQLWVADPREIVRRFATGRAPRLDPGIRLPAGGWRLLHDRHGQLWVASFGSGLLRVRDLSRPVPLLERVSYEHKLGGSPRSLLEDDEGNIWVGMRGGLLRLSRKWFQSVAPLDGVTNEGVRTVAAARDGSIWVATTHALNRFAGASQTVHEVSQTMALHEDRHGQLWVAASEQVGRLVGGRFVPLTIPETRRVMAITTDRQDRLWLCSSLKGVLVWDGQTIVTGEEASAVAGRGCQTIFTDSRGRIWMGFLSGGIGMWDRGTLRVFGEPDGIPPGTVLGFVETSEGHVWLSTSSGVSRYHDGRIDSMTHANAPFSDVVPVFVQDDDGYLWLGVHSGAGIVRFHPTEMDRVAASRAHRVEYVLFDESDGMQQGSQTWQSGIGGVRGADGRLWVATGLGMAVVDPAYLPPVRQAKPPRIEAVIADGRRLAASPGLTLPSHTRTVTVEYAAVSLTSASKLRFRYMLDGADDEWTYADQGREAVFTNVAPGDYRFRLSATNDGEWTEPVVWTFQISPPFYLTQQFAAVAAMTVGLLLMLGWWLRLRAVRSQYALVFAERARVSREIHDTLLQSLAAIGVEIETIATQLDPAQDRARSALRHLRKQVSRSVRDARGSILELRHTPQQLSLPDALRELADSTTQQRGVSVEFLMTGRPRGRHADVDMQLLRIGQEAVNNAVKHAQANHIVISLTYERDAVELAVTDDGCGFAVPSAPAPPHSGEHLGLVTMRERAVRAGGTLTIRSAPGSGTTVCARVPTPPAKWWSHT